MSTTLDGLLWVRAIRGKGDDGVFHLDAGRHLGHYPESYAYMHEYGTRHSGTFWTRRTSCGLIYHDSSFKGYVVRHMPASYIQCKNCQRTMPPPAVEFGERLRVLVEIDRLEEMGCGSEKADRWRAWVEEHGIND